MALTAFTLKQGEQGAAVAEIHRKTGFKRKRFADALCRGARRGPDVPRHEFVHAAHGMSVDQGAQRLGKITDLIYVAHPAVGDEADEHGPVFCPEAVPG